jgi:Ca-activated chloride channel family protein
MKKTPVFVFILVFISILFLQIYPVQADGIIIPEPPICNLPGCVLPPLPMEQLQIKYHHVDVTIDNQMVTTRVDQVFYNPNDYTIEGTYVFPLPLDAVVSKFVLWIDGKPVEGKVLDASQARQIYEDIVRKLADPALLEYIGRGAVQARVYPIPPQGERQIELEYQQALTAENGLVKYQYPLNTEKFSAIPLESVTVNVNIHSNLPIRAVYSPSHPVEVSRQDEKNVLVSYEATNIKPDTDFILYFSTGENEAFHLLSYLDPLDANDSDGYFLMLLAPKIGGEVEMVAKDLILVLDRSGSMEGEKFQQAQTAITYIIERLHPEDRFYLLTFSSDTEAFSDRLVSASQADEAVDWINRMGAMGSTDIDRALMEAAAVVESDRPTYMIFLTDGLPTRGVTDSNQILMNAGKELPDNVRLFPFGVGYDVDTFLLDSLAQNQHGLSTYIQPGEALDERLSKFYEKISTPVLTDLQIDFGGLDVYDVFPTPLPDLFEGNQVIITGRYRDGKKTDLTVTGIANGKEKNYRYSSQRFADGENPSDQEFISLPRLWATRKIGYLLNQIRLQGADQETIDQIVQLSLRYGIVTPYTSFLVTEDMPMGAEAQQEAAQDAYSQYLVQPTAAPSGMDAVQKAAEGGAMSQADQAAAPTISDQAALRSAGGRTFLMKDESWIDTTYDPETMSPIKIEFMSEDYFTLAVSDANLAAAFALGEQVLVVYHGQAFQVVKTGSREPTGNIQSFLTTDDSITPTSTPTSIPVVEIVEDNETSLRWDWILSGVIGLGLILMLILIGLRKKAG